MTKLLSYSLILFMLSLAIESYGYNEISKNKQVADTAYIDELNQKAYEVRNSHPFTLFNNANQALELSNKIGYRNGLFSASNLLGIYYKNKGVFDKAIENFLVALKVAEEDKIPQKISVCLNNIGSVYNSQGKYILAIDNYKRSLEIEKEIGNSSEISIRYYNLGAIYEAIDSLDLAYAYYNNSLLIEEETGNNEGIYFALYGLAGIESSRENFDNAHRNLNRAIAITREINDFLGIANCLNEQAKTYARQGNKEKAISYFKQSLYISDSIDYKKMTQENYKNLADVYKETNDYKNAFYFLELHLSITYAINNLEINNKIAELSANFDLEKKEHELQELNLKLELKELQSEYRVKLLYYFIAVFILVILFAVYQIRQFKKRKNP